MELDHATAVTCPVCSSHETRIDMDMSKFSRGMAIAECFCRYCLSDWIEVYRFDHIEDVYDATSKYEPGIRRMEA